MPLTITTSPMLQNALCSHTLHLLHTVHHLPVSSWGYTSPWTRQSHPASVPEVPDAGSQISLSKTRTDSFNLRILYLWVHQEKIGVFHYYLRTHRKYGVNKVNEMCLCKQTSFESVQVSSSLLQMMQAGGIHLLKKWNQICYARLKQPSWRHFVRFIPSFLGYLIHSD